MTLINIPERRILLPQRIDERLRTLAGLNQETSGVLLYDSKRANSGLDLMVNTSYMTGRGKPFEVGINPDRKAIIDHFLGHNLNYKSIEWHTHVTGNRGLSEEDRRHYNEELHRDPYFIAMIVTNSGRTTIKYRSGGDVRTVIIPTPDGFYAREKSLQQELEKSAKMLGLDDLPNLKATRSRR